MPVYQFSLVAKVNICMDGETPEMAAANLESLMEDAYMSIPCEGFEIKFGKYPASVWVQNDPPKLEQQMPEGYDPQNPPRMTMKKWMDICFSGCGDDDDDDDEPQMDAMQNEGGAVGKDLPLTDKDTLLKKAGGQTDVNS
jgi:hypothetical protein